ncbi:MAG: LysR family transcriptional regulator [Bauldia sp.]|nr:LysR family transcriptional regulator [Bauldia sp.]
MAIRDPDWTLWRTFRAVMREGSLSAAARALTLTQPTVGRHIDQLEADLGTALFTRSQVGLEPTAAAVELAPYADSMAGTAAALLRIASGEAEEVRGAIRISASEIVGGEILPPILGRFLDAHPAVAVELVLSNETEDLLRRQVDIAIRMVRPTQAALVARKLGAVHIGLHAHRRYLEAHGMPRTLADLASHTVIGFDTETPSIRAMKSRGIDIDRDIFSFRTDSDLAQLAAIRAGAGIGGCQTGLARRQPELIPVLTDAFGIDLEVWVAMHEDLRSVRRMRLMFDHLVEEVGTYVAQAGR